MKTVAAVASKRPDFGSDCIVEASTIVVRVVTKSGILAQEQRFGVVDGFF